jgi:hypothetical protein
MTSAKLSLETAPTTLEEMLKIGRFNFRLLAQELGLFADDTAKASFMQLSNEGQAKALLDAATKLRGGGKGKPAAAAGAGATQRTPATGKTGGRKPATETAASTTQAQVEDPAAARAPATAAAAAGAANTVKLMQTIAKTCEGIEGAISGTNQSVVELQSTLESMNLALWFNTALTLLQIEHTLAGEVSRDDIIEMALSEIPNLKNVIGTNQPTDEGDYPEGNE